MNATRPAAAVFLTLTLLSSAPPARAQRLGMPVWNSVGAGTGFLVALDAGFPKDRDTNYAIRAEAGVGPIRAGVSRGVFTGGSASGDQELTAVTGAFRMVGGGLNPVAMNTQAGYAHGADDVSVFKRYTASVGLGVNPPLTGFTLRPWISPGLRVTHRSGAESGTTTRFGVAGGLDATFGLLGGHVGFDREAGETTVGAGVHVAFGLPGS